MSQGCHLIYSHSDSGHFSLDEKIERPTVKKIANQFNTAYYPPWENVSSQVLVENLLSGTRINAPVKMHGRPGFQTRDRAVNTDSWDWNPRLQLTTHFHLWGRTSRNDA